MDGSLINRCANKFILRALLLFLLKQSNHSRGGEKGHSTNYPPTNYYLWGVYLLLNRMLVVNGEESGLCNILVPNHCSSLIYRLFETHISMQMSIN